jgi:hypothetical protein
MNLMALEENRWFARAYNRNNCFNFDLNEFRRQKFGGHVETLKQGVQPSGPGMNQIFENHQPTSPLKASDPNQHRENHQPTSPLKTSDPNQHREKYSGV